MGNTNEQAHGASFEALMEFATRYRADAAVRARIESGDYSDLELEVPEGTEIRVMENTPDTLYFPLPPNPHSSLSDKDLDKVAGGFSVGCMTVPLS